MNYQFFCSTLGKCGKFAILLLVLVIFTTACEIEEYEPTAPNYDLDNLPKSAAGVNLILSLDSLIKPREIGETETRWFAGDNIGTEIGKVTFRSYKTSDGLFFVNFISRGSYDYSPYVVYSREKLPYYLETLKTYAYPAHAGYEKKTAYLKVGDKKIEVPITNFSVDWQDEIELIP